LVNKDLEELTTHCIRCGFCLEACPTFTETGSEMESPRGRIYLVRSAVEGKLRWQEDVKEHLDQCLGCRACETACPSGVEYGSILELARSHIDSARPPIAKRMLLKGLTNPAFLRANLALGSLWPGKKIPGPVSRFVSGQAPEVDRPVAQAAGTWPPLREDSLPVVRGEVYLLEGCAMRVLFPRVHEATRRLLRRVGFTVREADQGCCGSLDAHNGNLEEGVLLAKKLVWAMPEELPVIVNSAGCGSTMRHYGDLFAEGASFASRVRDISEFLAASGLIEALADSPGLDVTATYHDACHLAHGQKIWKAPRALIHAIPNLNLVEMEEADTCCGSAGIYNVTEPALARRLLERKWRNVEATRATIVATGNPGCHAWIAQASREHGQPVTVLHTAELLESSFIGELPGA
jgi:glycolate oxidase iron-sulfur subunit